MAKIAQTFFDYIIGLPAFAGPSGMIFNYFRYLPAAEELVVIINLIYNLSVLVALTVVSGFIDTRYSKKTLTGKILQGVLFAIASIIGMLYPFILAEGIIFDGRSIIISICTLFFGPLTGIISSVISVIARIWIGGSGTFTGTMVISASFLIGYIFYTLKENGYLKISSLLLYVFGLMTSAVMMILMLTLPASFINDVFSILTLSVMVFYPIITLISGKVLLDHQDKKEYLKLLKHEKTLYLATLYSIGDGVISTDQFGNVVTLNHTAEKLTGWFEKEAAGKSLDEIFVIINEFTRIKVENPVTKVLREGRIVGLANHTLLISKNGNEIPITDSGSPIINDSGAVTGVVLVFKDQTEERDTRRRIEESEFRLRRAELASKSGNWELHLSEKKMLGSEGARIIYGVDSTEMDYEYIKNIPLPEYRTLLDTAVKNLIEKDEPYDLQFKIKSPDTGQIKDIQSTAFYDKEKKILFGVLQDITKQKRTEDALRESEKHYRELFMINPHPMWVYDIDTLKFMMVNDSAVLHYGYTSDEFLNMKISDIRPPSDVDRLKENVEQVTEGIDRAGLWRHRKKDGAIIIADIISHAMMFNGRKSEMVLALDVTDRVLAQEALRESEHKFRTLIEHSNDAFYLLYEGRFEIINTRFTELTGYSFEETQSPEFTFWDLISPASRQIVNQRIESRNKGTEQQPVYEITILSKDHREIECEISVTYINYKTGTAVQGIIRDITERKGLEEQIKESELKFRTITDFTYDWEYWSGPDNNLIYISPSCKRITGYSVEEFYNRPSLIQEIIYPDDVKVWNESVSILDPKSIFKCDLRIICKDKKLKWINHICNTIYSADGTYLGRRASNRDITERKQAEDSLLKLKKAVDTSREAIFLTDPNGIFTYINPAFSSLYGYCSSELVGKVTPRILKSGLLDNILYDQFWQTLISGNDVKGELINKRKTDGYVDIEGSASPILDEDNKIIGFLGIQRDITERKKSQLALKESEEKFRNIFANHSAIKLLLDPDTGNIVEANASAARFYNWSVDELEKMNISQINTLPLEVLKKEMEKTRNRQQTYFEFKHRRADGSIRDVEVYSSKVIIAGKDYLHSIIHDITEKKQAEQLLKENEEKMRLLVEGTSYFFFYTHNSKGEVTYISPSVEKITGYKAEEWVGQSHWFVTDSPLNSIARERTRKMLKGEAVKNPINLEIFNSSGNPILLAIYEVPLMKEGRIIGLQGIAHDITEKNRLMQNVQKLSFAVEQSPVSIIITDIFGNIEYVNPKFTEVTGFNRTEAIGKNPKLLKSGKHTKAFYSHLWESILAGRNWSGVFHNKRRNGELFWESAIISPIKDHEGKITNFIAVKEDITQKIEKEIELNKYRQHLENLVKERTEELDQLNRDLLNQLEKGKELEEQLNAALSKEKEVNELKTRFIATVSHEFRTPLASLLSSSQMIQRYSKKWSEEKLNDHYKRISSTINYLTRLLDDVLTISRTDREVLTNNPELVDIDELLKSYLEEVKPIVTPKHEIIFSNKCESKKLFIDYKLFRQIMVNLLTNAIKYSPDGGKIKLLAIIEKGKLNISLSDQGLGIPVDEIEYIFEPFYRSKNSLGIQGTGLGLNIVKRCTDILGGEIYLNTIVNEGTTFNIIIPISYEK